MSVVTRNHRKYGRVRVIRRVASNRGGLALIATRERRVFWVRAYTIGKRLWC